MKVKISQNYWKNMAISNWRFRFFILGILIENVLMFWDAITMLLSQKHWAKKQINEIAFLKSLQRNSSIIQEPNLTSDTNASNSSNLFFDTNSTKHSEIKKNSISYRYLNIYLKVLIIIKNPGDLVFTDTPSQGNTCDLNNARCWSLTLMRTSLRCCPSSSSCW